VDPTTNKAYVLWKSNDGSSSQPSHIWSQELNSSGTGLVGSPVELLTNNTVRFPWESTLDDPSMAYANGRYFLLFSIGSYLSAGYSEAFATCSGPSGPCTQPAGNPFLRTYDHAYGPAGGSLFVDASGDWWITYAAWQSSTCQSYSCGGARVLYVGPIDLGG
jgi:beta-xylosidase